MGFCLCGLCFPGKLKLKKCFYCLVFFTGLTFVLMYLTEGQFFGFDKYQFGSKRLAIKSDVGKFGGSRTDEKTFKTILAWTTKSGKKNWIPNNLKHMNCEVNRCKVTEDRTKLPESDVIIMHVKDINVDDLPPPSDNKPLDDRKLWALLNHEPPPYTSKHTLAYLNFQVDWTITYRADSTIFAPIYALEPYRGNVSYQPSTKKRKPATWLVSHCLTSSNREGFVSELRKHLQVDVYGKCGKKLRACPPRLDTPRCYVSLSNKYKFYLSFENSLCRDYVTEKLYLALDSGLIPVVFGGVDYSKLLPVNSYVDALKFSGPASLTKYLQKISKNATLYRSFFRWKNEFKVVQRRYKWLCDVCKRLHSEEAEVDRKKTTQERVDLLEWWFLEGQCKSWNGTVVNIDV